MEKREIKFRVFDGTDFMSKPFTLQDLQLGKVQFTSDCPLMQYTGLKDKNGKEIYEGDLSKNYYKGEWVILEVVWNPLGMWSVKWKDGYINNYFLHPQNFEVIGNIYENPSLLK